ncbi:MAG TPA: response regulator [Duganella sp.]|jgi:signal transduction histidine kinase
MRRPDRREERILVLAPKGRDAEVIAGVVERDGVAVHALADFGALTDAVMAGASAAVVAQEALVGHDMGTLGSWLAAQAPWSDFPFVVLLSRRLGKGDAAFRATLAALGNVVILERPLSAETLGSAVESALRARQRQYLAREALAERLAASEALAVLNQTLESRVSDRTRALSQANDQITAQLMERERTQQALAHYQKMEALGQLTGGVAHDFNNMLSIIQNSVELIAMISAEEKVRARALTAKAACQRGAKLTSQLLSFARNQMLDLRPISISDLFDVVTELAKPLLGADIEVVCHIEAGAAFVIADANHLEMAMLNLAINARDAMEGKGRLTMRSSRAPAKGTLEAGDYIRIDVSDTGPGMSPDIAAKVFEPFFTTKAVGKGTGLGLSQVYGMAQQSGGAAFVRSVEGHGATVEIWLPLAPVAAPAPVRPNDADALAGLKILLVEDDALVREGMAEALTSFGCEVAQTSSGTEGLAALAARRPDLLLTDYLMPGMTGAELACEARTLFPDLPILVATGYADMAAIESAIGGNAVLRKPFALSELALAVAKSTARG